MAAQEPKNVPDLMRRNRMTRRRHLVAVVAALTALATVLGACSPAASSPVGSPGTTVAPSTSGEAPSALPTGQTINVAVGSFMAPGVKMFTAEWEQKTGNKVNVVEIPYGDMYSKLSSAWGAGSAEFDIAIYAAGLVSEFATAGYLLDLEPYYPRKANWDTIVGPIKDATYIQGKRYAVPMDGDIIFGYYRKDALENPQYQADFKTKHGYDLKPPETWEQYKDIAEFFTGWAWGVTGVPGWGTLAARKPADVGNYLLGAQASAYAANPNAPGYLYFDPDTLEPQINNPAWVQAVQDWIDLKAFAPEQEATYGHGDMMGNWSAGDYALAVNWADLGVITQDTTTSIVQGKVGYFVLPGSDKVWNAKTKQWEEFSEPNHAPHMAFGGWKATVAATSKNPDLAFDFLDWIDSDQNSMTGVTTPGTARNPYRDQHFTDIATWEASGFVDPGPYLATQEESLNHPNVQRDLGILKAGAYLQALDTWSQQAYSGAMPVQEALDNCAKEWKAITATVDFETQKALYREEVGLE